MYLRNCQKKAQHLIKKQSWTPAVRGENNKPKGVEVIVRRFDGSLIPSVTHVVVSLKAGVTPEVIKPITGLQAQLVLIDTVSAHLKLTSDK